MTPLDEYSSDLPQDADGEPVDDAELVKAVRAGSPSAWRDFVHLYSRLIYGVLRRHLFAEDADEVMNVYVELLADLHDTKLIEYEGRASLSTWLFLVARGKAIDYLRKRGGRRRLPAGYSKLNDFDRRVFRLHFVEGLSFEIVLCTLNTGGQSVSALDIAQSVRRIEGTVHPRYLDKLAYEDHARRKGLESGRLLRYLIHAQAEYTARSQENRPDQGLVEEQVSREAAQVRELLLRLPVEERKVLFYRFNRGWSAKRISETLMLGGQRRVYTIIERALRKLRVWMESTGF